MPSDKLNDGVFSSLLMYVDIINYITRVSGSCTQISKYAAGCFLFELSIMQGKMIDMVFVVPDPVEWHKENMSLNPSHYSFLKVFGPNTIARIQQLPAAVYYNTLVTIDSQV